MKNNLIPAILDSLDETIIRCEQIVEDAKNCNKQYIELTSDAMAKAYQVAKNKIFDLSATNLGERIIVLKSFNPVLYNLFVNGDLRLSTAEELLQDENIIERINKLLPQA